MRGQAVRPHLTDSAEKSVVVSFTSDQLDQVADAAGDMEAVPEFVRDAAVLVASSGEEGAAHEPDH